MRKLLMIIAALALVAGVGLISESPASAHDFDGMSLTTCYAEHTTGWNLILHSHPVWLDPAFVDYGCVETDGVRCRHYFATRWWNGLTTRHNNGPIYIC